MLWEVALEKAKRPKKKRSPGDERAAPGMMVSGFFLNLAGLGGSWHVQKTALTMLGRHHLKGPGTETALPRNPTGTKMTTSAFSERGDLELSLSQHLWRLVCEHHAQDFKDDRDTPTGRFK